jgi:multiple sugar transport system permease protein
MATPYRQDQKRFIVMGLTPIVFLFGLIFIYPIFSALYISLTDIKLLSSTSRFVFFQNYISIFKDPVYRISFLNTLYFTLLYFSATMIIGLSLALFANKVRIKIIQSALQTVIFLPVITITVSAALIWKWMYVPSFGIINYLLGLINIGPLSFLSSSASVIPSIVLMTVWKWIGVNVIIFLAGLQAIPAEYFEAARIDGASPFQLFFHITLPMLKSTFEYISVTTIIASMQVFTEVFMLTGGGPGTSSRVLASHIYEIGFRFSRISEASSVAFTLFAFVLLLTIFQFRAFQREELY